MPHIADQILMITNRHNLDAFYITFIAVLLYKLIICAYRKFSANIIRLCYCTWHETVCGEVWEEEEGIGGYIKSV